MRRGVTGLRAAPCAVSVSFRSADHVYAAVEHRCKGERCSGHNSTSRRWVNAAPQPEQVHVPLCCSKRKPSHARCLPRPPRPQEAFPARNACTRSVPACHSTLVAVSRRCSEACFFSATADVCVHSQHMPVGHPLPLPRPPPPPPPPPPPFALPQLCRCYVSSPSVPLQGAQALLTSCNGVQMRREACFNG